MTFDVFREAFEKGMKGGNYSLKIDTFPALTNAIGGMHQSMYAIFGGHPGTGKTAFVDTAFVLSIYDWWLREHKAQDKDVKITWIYDSLERSFVNKLAKWVSYRLFTKHNVILDVADIMSWMSTKQATKYSTQILECENYFAPLLRNIEFFDKPSTPQALLERTLKVLGKYGKVYKQDEITRFKKHHSYHFIIKLTDHVGKLKDNGKGDKATIDEHSYNMSYMRDSFGMTIIDVFQFNRSMSDSQRKRNGDVTPTLDDFKGSGDPVENADLAIGLFNPYRYNLQTYEDYDLNLFVSDTLANRFRSYSILKNSYGVDDAIKGCGFVGESGYFTELPPPDEIDYDAWQKKLHIEKTYSLE